ncbi:hypothetical protein EDD29_7964 [Actinocorallia herbida]|uniref:Uncharacterized protein n=1 Tax=Actinocorallia herbida TaxID=58109 RepID=A0A3N1D9P4_9ACTN|nr:hypothetical protein [Actinocorallia herbida]ROO90242.1 hypothetical protein EDD29_7964 [Actinocorallia herbida]
MRHEDDDYGLPHVHVVVPDDARELDEDLAIWRREERSRLRKARWQRIAKPFQGWGLALPVTILVLLVAVLSGTLMTFFGPRAPRQIPPAQTLARSTAPPGSVGGLLPSANLAVNGAPMRTVDMRPALIAIIPRACDCDGTLRGLDRIADAASVRIYFLADRRTSGESVKEAHEDLWKISGRVAGSQASIVDDSTDLLPRTYQAHGLTVLVVKANGAVGQIMRDLRTTPEPSLVRF